MMYNFNSQNSIPQMQNNAQPMYNNGSYSYTPMYTQNYSWSTHDESDLNSNYAFSPHVVGQKFSSHFSKPTIQREYDFQMKYKTELCKNWSLKGHCSYGKKCRFAHGESELK